MVLDPNFCLHVPEGFDDSDADTGVHPMARKLFVATTAAEVFKKAHEWVHQPLSGVTPLVGHECRSSTSARRAGWSP